MSIRNKYRNWRLQKHVEKFGSKNNGYFNYFNREWFDEHQTTLIFLLNHWLLKFWFRWVLRIYKDCKFNEVIDKIEPHTYRIKVSENTYRSDFRTHQKFSKRIYYAFRPVWWLLHLLDWLIQKTVAPDFSFGFDTLTVYPNILDGNTTCDGFVRGQYYEDYYSAHSYGTYADTSDTIIYIHNQYYNVSGYYTVGRGFFHFDTSAITSAGTISSAYLNTSLSGENNENYYTVGLYESTATTNNLTTSNFANFNTTILSPNTSIGIMNINSTGLGLISKTSVTKYVIRLSGDVNNQSPSGFNNRLVYASDYSGVTYDPILVVTYTLPASGNKFQMVV